MRTVRTQDEPTTLVPTSDDLNASNCEIGSGIHALRTVGNASARAFGQRAEHKPMMAG